MVGVGVKGAGGIRGGEKRRVRGASPGGRSLLSFRWPPPAGYVGDDEMKAGGEWVGFVAREYSRVVEVSWRVSSHMIHH